MGKIVAIGGGEIGRPGFPVETTSIDKEIIRLTGKKKPRLLFIPTASNDSEGYIEVVRKHFGRRLKCAVDVLNVAKNNLSRKEIRDKVLSSDIIYVGGGNTLSMMKKWRLLGVDKILVEAYKKGIVLSGLSAGAICWFKYGNSDSRRYTSGSSQLIRVKGMGLINALHCPHYDKEKNRKKGLKEMMEKTPGIIAIALDECAAFQVVDDKCRIIRSKKDAKAYKAYWRNGKYLHEEIPCVKDYNKLEELLKI